MGSSSYPYPRDDDSIRYAILACIAEQLVDRRMELEMSDKRTHIYQKTKDEVLPLFPEEVAPTWAMNSLAIEDMWIADLPEDMLGTSVMLVVEKKGANPMFLKRKIATGTGYFYTV